jgi:TM2 domain-containing membrane protein YozV
MNLDSAEKKLEDGCLTLEKAGSDSDLLGLALTKIHAALEEACRIWLSEPTVVQDHQLDARDRKQVTWQEILNLMPQYYQWTLDDTSYIRNKNQLRNKIAHNDEFNITRQEVENYAQYVENLLHQNQLPIIQQQAVDPSLFQVGSPQAQQPENTGIHPIQPGEKKVAIAYAFWALGFVGLFGIHRFYLKRPLTGLLWLFSGGVFFIGHIVDLFLIPKMVRGEGLPQLSTDNPLLNTGQEVFNQLNQLDTSLQASIFQSVSNSTLKKTSAMHQLLEVAAAHGKVLSMGQAVRETGLSPEEVQKLLEEGMRKDMIHIGNDPETGAIRYYFDI